MSRFIRLDVFLILFASISWITLTIFTIQLASPEWSEPLDSFFHGDKILVKNIFLGVFFLSVYLFFNDYTDKVEKARDLEWNVMATNLVCLFFHLIILYLEHYVKPPISLPIWLNFLNNFNILIGTVFSANCFFYFKKLILFERNATVNKLWRIFEIMIFSSILLTVFNVNISEPIVAFGLVVYSAFALYLSTHMRWVAFLKKYQKIKVIAHFMVYFFLLCLILQNFFFESYAFGEDAHSHLLVIDCAHKFFLLSTFVFVLFYLTASVLILLFNLPTSEVFENNININKNFRKLSFQLNAKKDSNDIYKILLGVALSSSRSHVGFISLKGKIKRTVINCKHNIDERLAIEIDDALFLEEKTPISQTYIKNSAKSIQQVPGLIANGYLSVLRTPLIMNDEVIGSLVLLEKFEDAFELDILEVILSYCVQASISVENIVLFDKTLENERFQEEIKIAKKVREKLLPEKLNFTDDFASSIYSHSSDRIGGDYFEVAQISNEKCVFVMADVSGNGTTAAFNMAQLKGIFQVTVQNIKSFKDYPKAFNAALLTCLEQNSFVSMSMFLIDIKLKTIEHFRCGHLASYVLHENIIETLNPRGIGLGIINNNRLDDLMEHMIVPYESGDKLFCYTDGLIEYTNNDNIPFGTEKLYGLLNQNIGEEPSALIENITKSFKDFLGDKSISVDVTSICIKLP